MITVKRDGPARLQPASVAREAAIDALHGRVALPAPLVLKRYRREGESVVIDLMADSLPRLKWLNAGGTVRILADGRRVILVRHN
ncbi:MAG: hypothetical protein ACYCVE_08110 [Gemmatimonadaceae bacterium]